MAKKKTNYSITIGMGEVQKWHFITQAEAAEHLGIKNSSKSALESRCRTLGWSITFDN